MKRLRHGFSIFMFLALGACTLAPDPGPEAQAAAEQLAVDIDKKHREYVGGPGRAQPDIKLFARVFERVKADYVRPVDEEMLLAAASQSLEAAAPPKDEVAGEWLVEHAIKSMLASLDPYSTYLPRDEYDAMKNSMRGEFGGLGIQITGAEDGNGIVVIAPLEGTPADRAGMRAGDRITHVDGRELQDIDLSQIVGMLRGPVNSRVVLTVEREGRGVFDQEIIRAVIHLDVVKWRLEGDFGYLRISGFSENTAEEVEDAITEMRSHLGGRLAGLIIDLRNNPGGLLTESVAISDAFIEYGDIVVTKGRNSTQRYRATSGDIVAGLPIAVLINRGSASASEILAGALRDHERAVLIGSRSFGKGTVQTVMPMGRGTALKLTTAQYFRPSGNSVDGGIEPDVEVQDDKDTPADESLDRALAELNRLAAL